MALSFSYGGCHALAEDFAREVPALLARHPRTADLALQLEKFDLPAQLEARFSVAVVGQMRVGKSTLLNALIGRDLAPTGVNETTATVNRFRPDPHPGGPASLAGVFRVHDRDGGEEDFPLANIGEWLGRGERARHTRRIDFFADTPFLRRADLVDTPGLRSVIDTHQTATMSFLEERLENDSLAATGRADAVIYAINPVARETDGDMLALFGDKTRLPGAAAWNSVAVVQKWETLSGDPLEEAEKKCARQRRQLEGKVSAVIPTSGLLARLADKLDEPAWEAIARLSGASGAGVDELLADGAFFADDLPGVPVPPAERAALQKRIPWPCLRLLVLTARSRGWRDAAAVRAGARVASGLDALGDLLERRFFTLSSLIKVSGALRKASMPCRIALLRLREQEEERRAMLAAGRGLLERLSNREGDREWAEARDYIQQSLSAVEADMRLAEEIQIRLECAQRAALDSFAVLENDIESLERLDALPVDVLSSEEIRRLRALFGVDGPDPDRRLGMNAPTAALLAAAEDWLAECQDRSHRAPPAARPLYESACQRLEQLANHLEDILDAP